MTLKIGINGLGRIGRMVLRSIFENKDDDIKVIHINNRSSLEVSSKLLKYDSVHGEFKSNILTNNNNLTINNSNISFSQESSIEKINWKKFGVDIVMECTGKFNDKKKLLPHIKNGAKKVIVSAPCKSADKTIVYGVNHANISKKDKIISAASCTTNCLAPVAHVLNEEFGIEKGIVLD